jgi:Cd2+/Zn2+-exporting ATPase
MNTRRKTFKIYGMDCAEEVATLKNEIGPMVGGEQFLAFDLLNAKMIVSEEASASSEAILKAVALTGMTAEPWHEGVGSAEEKSRRQKIQSILTILSGGLIILAFCLNVWSSGSFYGALGSEGMGRVHGISWASKGAYLGAMFAACWFIAPKAWLSARRLRPDMNLLMMVAILGAISIGEWFEAATVSFLFAVSNALEGWSLSRARRAVEALMDLTPPLVQVVREGGAVTVRPEDVSVGTLFQVKPGERVPLDGLILDGASSVNQAPITGESLPVTKIPGEEVFAGSINGDGTLVIECSKPASDTVISRIIRLIGEASTKRAASEQWVDRFAKIYTPVVMILALLMALIPPLMAGGGWGNWFYRALILLVIACPCALVISTPVSIVAGLASAARHGVLVKGGMYLEAPSRLKAIAFDKTGTLTEGHPSVVRVVPLNGHTEQQLLRVAGSMESQSDHPLARAIVAYVKSQGVAFLPAQGFQALQGKGAMAKLDGRAHWLGSHRFIEEQGAENPDIHAQLESLEVGGQTVVAFGEGRELIGFLALADAVRPSMASILQNLREIGVEHLVLLTGDNRGTAEAVGRRVGLTEIQAELMPEDKVKAIEALVAKYGQVAMIGDGVNDAPAMARASLGIAMGAMGSDAAIETADIALMNDDLTRIPWLVSHSRRTLSVIRQNITFALAVKVMFVLLTVMGHASLWSAIAADMGASFLVIFNGLKLLRN